MKDFLICSILLLVLTVSGKGQPHHLRTENGTVRFTSDAPLELISASSNALKGIIDVNENNFAFAIDMKGFTGFNSDLQQTHFNENYVESQKFPRATFTGKIIERIDWNAKANLSVRAKGILEIHGVRQERIIPSKVEILADRVIIRSEFTVPLKDHDISIPKIVAQKISEKISVAIVCTIIRETDVN